MTALRARLLEVFAVEHQDHLQAIRRILAIGEGEGASATGGAVTEAARRAHSLKGAARAVGLAEVERLAHQLESLFNRMRQGELSLSGELSRQILDTLDEIEDRVAGAGAPPAGKPAPAMPPAAMQPLAAQTGSVRVDAQTLDALLTAAGELHEDVLYQGVRSHESRQILRELAALADRASRLVHGQGGTSHARTGGAPAAQMREAAAMLASDLQALARRSVLALQAQERGTRSLRRHLDGLQQRVCAARTVTADSVFGGFRKMVRDLAAAEGKDVEVSVEGLDCQADRMVLQRIKDPVMHMLRNAVGHGIETPTERQRCGKESRGHVSLRVEAEGDKLVITVEDDGRGIDFARLADRAASSGLLSPQEAAAATEEALCQLLFEPGFTTAAAVTTVSGRGLGLSVARDCVASLLGTITVHARPGQGTRITATVPVSILSRRLLLVSFHGQSYALPCEAIVKVVRVAIGDLARVDGRPALSQDGLTVPVVSLGQVLQSGQTMVAGERDAVCAVLVGYGVPRLAVAVDALIGVGDFVVRTFDALADARRVWCGAIRAPDGMPCLVLSSAALSAAALAAPCGLEVRSRAPDADRAKVVLVVDDSITTRTLEKSILEAHGYRVRLSVDGRDALNQLRREPADVVVSDIEMPHVDGFELVQAVKQDAALATIPVILVTSRENPADRARGLALGADAYIVKQSFDQDDLLRTIEQMV